MRAHPHATYELMRDEMKYPFAWHFDDNNCPPHYHSTLELIYQTEGESHAVLDGAEQTLGPGGLLLVPSYTIHTFTTQGPVRGFLTLLPLDYIPALKKRLHGKGFSGGVFPACAFTQQAAAHMEKLVRHAGNMEKDNFAVRGEVYLLLDVLLNNIPVLPRQKDSDHSLMLQVLAYLNENFTAHISQDEVASHFGYSPAWFSRIFNHSIGCSMPDYINMLRVREAARALREQDVTVTQAAMAAGFESSRTFYRAFKATYGMTATEFLKSHQTT